MLGLIAGVAQRFIERVRRISRNVRAHRDRSDPSFRCPILGGPDKPPTHSGAAHRGMDHQAYYLREISVFHRKSMLNMDPATQAIPVTVDHGNMVTRIRKQAF